LPKVAEIFTVQSSEESCELPTWLIDRKQHPAGLFYENLNGTKKFHLKSDSLVVTSKHPRPDEAASAFAGLPRSKMTFDCNSVEVNDDLKRFARIVMQVNFDW
jgi:hypothetical protein